MRILAFNLGHDGSVALVQDGRLRYCIEAEKDNGIRHQTLAPALLLGSLIGIDIPNVLALSGTNAETDRHAPAGSIICRPLDAGYLEERSSGKAHTAISLVGQEIPCFSSSHVRSHIMCAYGLSPYSQGQPCYVLVWEGLIGSLYEVDEAITIHKVGDILDFPGSRYSFLYDLADVSVAVNRRAWFSLDSAGKLMAIAAYGERRPPKAHELETIDAILGFDIPDALSRGAELKSIFSSSKYCSIGVESPEFKDLAWQFSERLFGRFHAFARQHVRRRQPLLIAGGCGLNCEWNTRWKHSNLFSDVFVPPCANDSGIAVGAAVDALHHYTGQAKIEWDVYAGETFTEDLAECPGFRCRPLDLPQVSGYLIREHVIAWVQGRCEMGPRALGNRSLLAAPFTAAIRDRLNRIKQREPFRPIAPICLEEDFGQLFEQDESSPFMLHFQMVRSSRLAAVTHVDGSARAQTVNAIQNPMMHALLREFRNQSGVGVLCNTSLNFKGRGFINRLSDLCDLAHRHDIDGFVVGNRFWSRTEETSSHRL